MLAVLNAGALQPAKSRRTGLGDAHWIAAPFSTQRDGAEQDGSRPMPIFRRELTLREQPLKATLRIVGLGQWDAWIADAHEALPVAPAGLHGAWTDYRKTVTYDTLDVTRLVHRGAIVLSVMLGNGMYNVQKTTLIGARKGTRYTKFAGSFGAPKLIASLELKYAGGRTEIIDSDAQWKSAPGPLLFDSAYGGEDFDARRNDPRWKLAGFDDHAWQGAAVVEGPGGELIPAIAPPVGVHEIYQPLKVTTLAPGRVVYDLGQNFAGIVRIRAHGPAGSVLRLTPGELLNADGTVSQATFHGPMWWAYTLRGGADEEWQPLFDYMGFRYVQADWVRSPWPYGDPMEPPGGAAIVSLEGVAEHTDAREVGSFESSSEMLNRIHRLILASMHNNEVSLMTDCPHREKLGWLEQSHLQADGMIFNNDLQKLMAANDRNMADAQWDDGIVPTIAPEYTRFGSNYGSFDDSPEWGSAAILEPWWTYTFYGDRTQLEKDYPMMQRYIAALAGKAKNGIVEYGLGDWYDIGPKPPGLEQHTTLGVTATLMLVQDAQTMRRIAALLDHASDAAHYAELAARTVAAFNARFWDPAHQWYDTGGQTANAMPLALGIVPAERHQAVLEHLIADIHAHDDHTNAGEIGYPYLLRALAKEHRDDVILAMLMRKDPPSYGSQLAAGATALTEAWDANPHSSQDHLMLGGAEQWLYRRLAGIDFDRSRADAAERVTVRPVALRGVDWVRAGFDSSLGHVQSDWKRDGARMTYRVEVPKGTSATIVLPAGARSQRAGVHPIAAGDEVRFIIGPGTWTFTAPTN
jgi:hypothetical protein